MTEYQKIQEELNNLYKRLKTLQETCDHPKEHVSKIISPKTDYKIEIHFFSCSKCGKSWDTTHY